MMKTSISLNAHSLLPTPKFTNSTIDQDALFKYTLFTSLGRTKLTQKPNQKPRLFVVQAKGKGGRMPPYRQPQQKIPTLPKIEDDGLPRFVIFVRMANLYLWYPVSIVAGGTTAKIMIAAKDNFLGKYIYKDTLTRNLAAVIYKDEEEVQDTAKRMHRILQSAKEFRYGYKLVENGNLKAALMNKDVIELPKPDAKELKTVAEKVKDFFKVNKELFQESFKELTSFGSTPPSLPSTSSKRSTPSKKKRSSRVQKRT